MNNTFNIEAGHLLRPQAGDLLVFTTERRMTGEQAEAFAAVMQAQLPGVKALMLQDGMQLAEIHTNEEIKRLRAQLKEWVTPEPEPAPEPFDLDAACQQAMERITQYIDSRCNRAMSDMTFSWHTRKQAQEVRRSLVADLNRRALSGFVRGATA